MRMEQERHKLRQENAILKFNAAHQVGTRVRFWTGLREGSGKTGVTWTEAQLLGGHTAVVYLRDDDGKNVGCVSLTHVEPIADEIGGAQ